MEGSDNPVSDLFWRDEILQIMYWFRGEGFGDAVTLSAISRFLADDAPPLESYMRELVDGGYLRQTAAEGYSLTAFGRDEAARRFHDAFEGLTKPAHGECSADCACHTTGDPEACENRQPQHVH